MPIPFQAAIDACEMVVDLSKEAREQDANHLVLGPEVVATIHKLADAITGPANSVLPSQGKSAD